MQVTTFAPALKATQLDTGGADIEGFPMTSFQVDGLPAQITIPVVISVHAPGGSEYDPHLYLVATSPQGKHVAGVEFDWHWPDNPGSPVKFRVFVHHLPVTVQTAGVYTLGLYEDHDLTQRLVSFPLPVSRMNPLLGRPSGI